METIALTPQAVMQRYPLALDPLALQRVLEDTRQKVAVYTAMIIDFERVHDCTLKEFEQKIARQEVPEHPAWETAIEWGVATDELQKLRVIEKGLQWILNFWS